MDGGRIHEIEARASEAASYTGAEELACEDVAWLLASVRELEAALRYAHEWLERVDEVGKGENGAPRTGYIGLDHAAGTYPDCSLCAVLAGETAADPLLDHTTDEYKAALSQEPAQSRSER